MEAFHFDLEKIHLSENKFIASIEEGNNKNLNNKNLNNNNLNKEKNNSEFILNAEIMEKEEFSKEELDDEKNKKKKIFYIVVQKLLPKLRQCLRSNVIKLFVTYLL